MDASTISEAVARHRAQGPLYRQLSRALDDLIGAGVLAAGASLPAERELAQMTGLSRVTVRKAVHSLVESGKLIQRQGSGTYVAPEAGRVEQPLQHLTSFSEDMRRRGMTARSVWLSRGLFPPTNEEMMALGLSVADRVARLDRVRLADERPMAIERARLPASVLPDPESVDQSLYALLSARGLCPVRGVQRITAANVTPADAETLGVLPGTAVLKVERVSYLPSGRAVELTRSFYRGDAYDFVAELK